MSSSPLTPSSSALVHVRVGRCWLAVLCSALLLGACSVAPPSADEVVAAAAERKSSLNDDKGAIADLRGHIAKYGDASGRLAWELARASARSGDVNGALAALEACLKSRFATPEQTMNDPSFVALRTDIRFLTLITGSTVTAPTAMAAPAPAATGGTASAQAGQLAQTENTTARLNGGAVEARAGGVSVRLPD